MRPNLNALSGLITAVGLLGIVVAVTGRFSTGVRVIAVVAAAAVLAGAFAFLRSDTSAVKTPADLDRALASGQPVALEFFSNF